MSPHDDQEPAILIRLPADLIAALDAAAKAAGRSRAAVLRHLVAEAAAPPPSADAQRLALARAAARSVAAAAGGAATLRAALTAAAAGGWEEHGAGVMDSTILLRRGAVYALLWRGGPYGSWSLVETPTPKLGAVHP